MCVASILLASIPSAEMYSTVRKKVESQLSSLFLGTICRRAACVGGGGGGVSTYIPLFPLKLKSHTVMLQ